MSSDELLNQFVTSLEEAEQETKSIDQDPQDLGPTLYASCVRLWNYLYPQSEVVTEGRVWQGKMTEAFQNVNIPPGTYSPVMKRMQAMGCLSQIRRGGGGRPSVYLLASEPTLGAFEQSRHGGFVTIEQKKISEQEALITSLRDRIGRLESTVSMLVEWKIQTEARATNNVRTMQQAAGYMKEM